MECVAVRVCRMTRGESAEPLGGRVTMLRPNLARLVGDEDT